MDELPDPEDELTAGNAGPAVSSATRLWGIAIAISYGVVVLAAGVFANELGGIRWAASLVAALPPALGVLFGIPKVIRARPIGPMVLFHLIAYPLLAALTIGLPGAFIAWRVSLIFAD